MSDDKPDLSRLSEVVSGLGPHEHLCIIYETQEEQFATALPFLSASLKRHEKCLCIAHETMAAAFLEGLRKRGIDVDQYLRSGAMTIASKRETYVRSGHFDPDSMIRFLSQVTDDSGDGKFPGVRAIVGEMTWALDEGIAPESLIEYEAKLSRFVRDHDVRILCQYQRGRFAPEVILGVIRTHPEVVYKGLVSKNPYYVPPDEFLKPNQPSREVERLLNNILSWQHSLTQLRALADRLQTVQETERKHLARELHDEIGQLLTGLRLLLRSSGDSTAGELKRRFEQARTIVDDVLTRVRALSSDLRPADLDELGLLPALLALFDRYTLQTGIVVNFKHRGMETRLESPLEMGAYRIVQETLTNAARHAGVDHVTVHVWADREMLNIRIADRGRGFDPEAALKAPNSSGLIGMQERVTLLGGRMIIESSTGSGSTITVELPLKTGTA